MSPTGGVLASLQWVAGRLSLSMGLVAGCCMVLMTVATLAEVFRRYVFGRSFLGVLEFIELLVAITFFALLSYTQFLKAHLRLTLFTDRLPRRLTVPLETVVLFLILAFVTLMLWQAWEEALHATRRRQIRFGAVPYPVWPAKLGAAVGITVMAIQVLVDFLDRLVAGVRGQRPAASLGRTVGEAESA